MKKIIYILGILVLVIVGYFIFKKGSVNLKYEEPNTQFVSNDQVNSSDIVVKITDEGFNPSTINIKKGTKVTWVNLTSGNAWPASNPHPTHTDYPEFDPQLPIKAGQAWSFTFNKVGNWGYHNHLDSLNRGVVNVTE